MKKFLVFVSLIILTLFIGFSPHLTTHADSIITSDDISTVWYDYMNFDTIRYDTIAYHGINTFDFLTYETLGGDTWYISADLEYEGEQGEYFLASYPRSITMHNYSPQSERARLITSIGRSQSGTYEFFINDFTLPVVEIGTYIPELYFSNLTDFDSFYISADVWYIENNILTYDRLTYNYSYVQSQAYPMIPLEFVQIAENFSRNGYVYISNYYARIEGYYDNEIQYRYTCCQIPSGESSPLIQFMQRDVYDIEPDVGGWLLGSLNSFLEFEIYPGFKLVNILTFLVAIPLLLWLLRLFLGG